MTDPCLEIHRLKVEYSAAQRTIPALSGLSLTLRQGSCLGLIGPSGEGKTTLIMTILGLLPPQARVVAGQVLFLGQDLLPLPEARLRAIRGSGISLIAQDPRSSLNPLRPVLALVAEVVRAHQGLARAQARKVAIEALGKVGVPEPLAKAFPHELSGGLCQRVSVAMALVSGCRLLLADEPTSAMDALVQGGILDLLRSLCRRGMALLLVSHDLAMVSQVADEIAIMERGRVVEQGVTAKVLDAPRHPLTRRLLRAWMAPAEEAGEEE